MRYFSTNNGPRDFRGQAYERECELRDRDNRALSKWKDRLYRLEKGSGNKAEINKCKMHIEELKERLKTYW
jgi:hypothetical protein